ncbi:unnamed protein product [Schistosoma rodhaini]|nr:unnamed protein product [Schistosoma rodhaini]
MILLVIFDVKTLITDTWKNLYTRLGDTFKCFLKKLPISLGGENRTCIEEKTAINVLFDKALGDEPLREPINWDEVNKINDVERGITMFRKNEMLLKSQISTMSQNLVKKNRAITQYLNCKSKQQQEETFKLFIKEMNKQFKNNNLTSFTDYSTVKDCFIKEEEIFERKKSSENNEDCTLSETFPEEDIKALDQLISKKYDILWRWNKALFNYEFASRNIKSTVYFLQKCSSHAGHYNMMSFEKTC